MGEIFRNIMDMFKPKTSEKRLSISPSTEILERMEEVFKFSQDQEPTLSNEEQRIFQIIRQFSIDGAYRDEYFQLNSDQKQPLLSKLSERQLLEIIFNFLLGDLKNHIQIGDFLNRYLEIVKTKKLKPQDRKSRIKILEEIKEELLSKKTREDQTQRVYSNSVTRTIEALIQKIKKTPPRSKRQPIPVSREIPIPSQLAQIEVESEKPEKIEKEITMEKTGFEKYFGIEWLNPLIKKMYRTMSEEEKKEITAILDLITSDQTYIAVIHTRSRESLFCESNIHISSIKQYAEKVKYTGIIASLGYATKVLHGDAKNLASEVLINKDKEESDRNIPGKYAAISTILNQSSTFFQQNPRFGKTTTSERGYMIVDYIKKINSIIYYYLQNNRYHFHLAMPTAVGQVVTNFYIQTSPDTGRKIIELLQQGKYNLFEHIQRGLCVVNGFYLYANIRYPQFDQDHCLIYGEPQK